MSRSFTINGRVIASNRTRRPGELTRAVKRMHARGLSDSEIADELNVTPGAVFAVRKRMGWLANVTHKVSGSWAGAASWACRMDEPLTRDRLGRFTIPGKAG